MRFSVGARSADTAATGDHAAMSLWNPHATIPLYLKEIRYYTVAATLSVHALYLALTVGTPASSVAVLAQNCWDLEKVAPTSVAALKVGPFSVQPTYVATPIATMRQQVPAVAGNGYVWQFDDLRNKKPGGYVIPPGRGAAVVTPVATVLQAGDWLFIWDEFSGFNSQIV